MHSLRAGMLTCIVIATVLGVAVYFVLHALMINWVENYYNSEDNKEERYREYFDSLQDHVKRNKVSSEDTAAITRWVRSNRNVYVFLYKDDQLFYDGSLEGDDNAGADNEKDEGTQDAPDTDIGDGKDDSTSNPDNTTESRPNSGITVDYPTREEIIETAGKNGLLPLELSDGTLFVSLVDFTEYIYYDIANIVSLASAFVTLAVVLMLYFHNITSKISRLAHDVSLVYEVDVNTSIRTAEGDDELAGLTRNVERMRSSMLESLEKEKEALNANSELITSMSHDIRTPLTVLVGYLDIMKNHSGNDALMQEYIKASETTALKLKDLSDDMFRYFLVFGGGEIQVDMADYDARTLIDQLLTEHVLLLGERGYEVKCHIASRINDSIRVSTDAPKVMRVIDNLFSNIYKYADENRPITVAAGMPGNGKISIAIKNYIKENSSDTESNRIGLKTCKKLCEALGIGFEYKTAGLKNFSVFIAKLELQIKKES